MRDASLYTLNTAPPISKLFQGVSDLLLARNILTEDTCKTTELAQLGQLRPHHIAAIPFSWWSSASSAGRGVSSIVKGLGLARP